MVPGAARRRSSSASRKGCSGEVLVLGRKSASVASGNSWEFRSTGETYMGVSENG